MIFNPEFNRIEACQRYKTKFIYLGCIRDVLGMPANEEVEDSFHEESSLIYCYLEDLLYMNFWKWLRK
jgi:hypothetical protein